MNCFRVIFELSEPVIAPHGIALDGLLAAAAVKIGHSPADAHLKLPLRSAENIWHASELFFVGPAQSYKVPYVRSLKPESWDRKVFRQDRGGALNKVVARDELKNLLDEYEAIATPAAVAWGVGDLQAVEDLLASIEAIGKKAVSRAYGRIASILVETVDGDPSRHGLLNANGYALRNPCLYA